MKFTDIKIGDKEKLTHVITPDDIKKFVELTGDDNKLHMDEKFASKTQFKKPVVHGMLGASFISTIIGTKMPGDGALWFSQSLDFLLPVRVGDKLTIVAEVVQKIEKDNIVKLKTDIYNQNRQIVTHGFAKVKLIESKPIVKNDNVVSKKSDKIALIIGGTGGIGRAACIQLAKDGFDIIVHYYKNKSVAGEIKAQVEAMKRKAYIIKADVLNETDIKNLISNSIRAFNKIDVLVNCAAATIPNIKVGELLWEDFQTQLEFNIKTSFSIIKEVIPIMSKNGYGKIINIGSSVVDKPNIEWAHYITAKAALTGLTKSLALELSPKGIRVNLITPSLVDTDLTADIPEKIKLLTAAQTPLRELAKATDVAGVISFLASSKSDFLTGENIRVNGGQIMVS